MIAPPDVDAALAPAGGPEKLRDRLSRSPRQSSSPDPAASATTRSSSGRFSSVTRRLARQYSTYRDANGGFAAPGDVMNVPGVGPKRLEALQAAGLLP